MISYAGILLEQPPPELIAWIEAEADPRWPQDFVPAAWPGPSLLRFDGPLQWPKFPVRINTLFWPAGAARFAVGYYLTDLAGATAIRKKAFFNDAHPPAAAWTPRDLVINDGVTKRTISLYCLPFRPLQQITLSDKKRTPTGFYLLTLVDDRYLWWTRQGVITISAGVTTWAALYAQFATLLGITLTVDTVPAAYLTPPADLAAQYDPLPVLLDTAAWSVNQRLVRDPVTGFCRMWNADSSVAQHKLNTATLGQVKPLPVTKEAGGVFLLGDGT